MRTSDMVGGWPNLRPAPPPRHAETPAVAQAGAALLTVAGALRCRGGRGCREQVLIEEAGDQVEQVRLGSLPLADAVGPVGILHHLERLPRGYQGVDQHLAVLV